MIKAGLDGVEGMLKAVKEIAKKFPDRVANALYIEAQIEMTESKRRCPVSPIPGRRGHVPGTLRASGQVHKPERSGNEISVTMSYGTEYAVVQHENLTFHHTTGQAKYLESVLNESRQHMSGRIARRIHLKYGTENL